MPKTEFKEIPGIRQEIEGWAQEWSQVRFDVVPTDPASVATFMAEAVTDLQNLIDGFQKEGDGQHPSSANDILDLKSEAEKKLHKAGEDLKKLNQDSWGNGSVSQTDVTNILKEYAEGYYAYTQICYGGDPVNLVSNWNEANKGNQVNCPQLVTRQTTFENQIQTSFVPQSPTMTSSVSFSEWLKTYSRFATGLAYSYYPGDVNQAGLVGELGVRYPVANFGSFPLIVGGKLVFDPFISWTADPDHRLMTIELGSVFPTIEVGTEIPTSLNAKWDNLGFALEGGIWPRFDAVVTDNPGDRFYYPQDKFPWNSRLGGTLTFGPLSIGGDWARDANYESGVRVYGLINVKQGGQQ